MTNKSYNEQILRVAEILKKYAREFSSDVKVYSDFIEVNLKTSRLLRGLPEISADEMAIFADQSTLVLRYYFYYEEEKEDAK